MMRSRFLHISLWAQVLMLLACDQVNFNSELNDSGKGQGQLSNSSEGPEEKVTDESEYIPGYLTNPSAIKVATSSGGDGITRIEAQGGEGAVGGSYERALVSIFVIPKNEYPVRGQVDQDLTAYIKASAPVSDRGEFATATDADLISSVVGLMVIPADSVPKIPQLEAGRVRVALLVEGRFVAYTPPVSPSGASTDGLLQKPAMDAVVSSGDDAGTVNTPAATNDEAVIPALDPDQPTFMDTPQSVVNDTLSTDTLPLDQYLADPNAAPVSLSLANPDGVTISMNSAGRIMDDNGVEIATIWRAVNQMPDALEVVFQYHTGTEKIPLQTLALPAGTETYLRSSRVGNNSTHSIAYGAEQIVKAASNDTFNNETLVPAP